MLYNISEDAHKWILEFLARTDLKGREAPILTQILQVLNNPIQEEPFPQPDKPVGTKEVSARRPIQASEQKHDPRKVRPVMEE